MNSLSPKAAHTLRVVLIVLAVVAGIFLVFAFGVAAGYRAAQFSGRFGDAYERNFIGHSGPGEFFRADAGHGTAGRIVSVALPNVVVEGRDGVEKTVVVASDTQIRRFDTSATSTDLAVDDFIVVLGEPGENGDVAAKLIRILPPPPIASSTSSH
jgi:hypothetical protein